MEKILTVFELELFADISTLDKAKKSFYLNTL